MSFLDYLIISIIIFLFILVIVYLIKNKGCTSSTCKNCAKYDKCHKKRAK